MVLGRVEEVTPEGEGKWLARISYHIDATGRELPQFLNVVLGNASLLRGVKAIDLPCNQDVLDRFPGDRFGTKGLRSLTGRESGGYVCTVIKPQGSPSEILAKISYQTARVGADIIK